MRDLQNAYHLGAWGGLALLIIIALPLSAAAATTGVSPLINNLEFSAGPAQLGLPTGLPAGTPPSCVAGEQFGPFWPGPPPGAADSADDDIYQADGLPVSSVPILPFSNIKIVDDGFPTVPTLGIGLNGPPPGLVPPPPQCTIPTDQENIDALATDGVIAIPATPEDARTLLLSGLLFVQFSVDNAAQGLPGSGVNLEATAVPAEQPGDVYEAIALNPIGSNVVIADEDACGLALPGPPQDDLDALILQMSVFDALGMEDTDGDMIADTPLFYFSCDKSFLNTGGATIDPADICMPGPLGMQPWPIITAAAMGLAAGSGDNIDALYVDQAGPVLFSLAAGSPSLAGIVNLATMGVGAAPGDIIHAVPGISPPIVVLGANEIGLQGTIYADPQDDELNALWIWDATLAAPLEIPVELSVFSSE
ncbi:hypothetical protein JXA47_16575 [Candidatus Sumerlaeota bacterium]|nr:hypothetical protein [Candidatus Sumerlaeota bacterium]